MILLIGVKNAQKNISPGKKNTVKACNEMKENYDVKVEGAAYGLKITKPGIFKDNLGKVHAAVCSNCGYLEFYLEETDKIK